MRTHGGILSSRQDHPKGARPRKRGDDAPVGQRARSSDPPRTARVRIGSSGLRALVSRRGSAISSLDWARDPEQVEGRRTVMNNAG
jgi:hypothetical protein